MEKHTKDLSLKLLAVVSLKIRGLKYPAMGTASDKIKFQLFGTPKQAKPHSCV